MILGDLNTHVAAQQLKNIFDIEEIFKRRGRKVTSFQDLKGLLFDPTTYGASDKYYEALGSSSFRRIMGLIANSETGLDLNSISHQCGDLESTKINDILRKGLELELAILADGRYASSRGVNFGHTFEWYVAEVSVRELASIAYWGVNVEGLPSDYDVVLIRENQLGYIECKSGKLSNITKDDINNFLIRERVLAPQFSVFLVDGVSRENLKDLTDYVFLRRNAH